jgi:hypothetical protein
MTTKRIRFTSVRGLIAIELLFLFSLLILTTGCGTGTAAPAATPAGAPPQATAQGSSAGKPIDLQQAAKPNGKVDCTAIHAATIELGQSVAQMVNFRSDTDYAAFADATSPVHLDFPKLRAQLDTLATLPDPTDSAELTFGKPSESVAYFRELVDVAESDLNTQGKPFKDTGGDGRKVIGFDTPWAKEFSSFGLATEKACPN